jgi:uncharacterized protein (DUF2384 family)
MCDDRLHKETLPNARHAEASRTNVDYLAAYLSVPSRQLLDAVALAGADYAPEDLPAQPVLRPIVQILDIAESALGDRASVKKWLNRPLPELENESPLAVILAGEAGAVATLLQNARGGIPG